jgi:phospholipid/cholesterol/gamma-HCH transport system substrate-binding protein
MRILTTELKVGLLILSGIGIIVYSSVVVTGWRPGQSDTYALTVYFSNASGLLVGSPVQVAGVKIGQVEDIGLEQGQAKVSASIYKRFAIYADATATIKSLGILGDKYIEVRPGTPSQAELRDGDTIVLVLPGSDLDSLIENLSDILHDVKSVTGALKETLGGEAGKERLDTILNQIARATSDISRITDATNRQIDTILDNLTRFTGNLDRITAENREALKQTIANFAAFSDDLKQLTAHNRESLERIIASLDTFSQALAQDGPSITSDLKEVLAQNKQSLNNAISNLDSSFGKLDKTMTNIESISAKLDRGEGTIGRLLNDESTVDELNSALTGLNKFLTEADRIRLDIGGHVEYLVTQQDYKSYLDIRLQPLKDRYYLLQLVDNPRGSISKKTTTSTVGGVTTVTDETVSEDKLQLSLLIAQRYYDTVLKGGLMENTFGVGLEQYFGRGDDYRIGLDVWDFGNDLGPHVKLTGYWRFFSNAFLVVGGDDLASKQHEFRDAFFGIGLHFNEDSLKPIFSSVPLGNLGK